MSELRFNYTELMNTAGKIVFRQRSPAPMRRLVENALESGVVLRDVNLTATNLRRIDLRSEDFSGAKFCKAELNWADLAETDLVGANFAATDLTGVRFTRSDLTNANVLEAKSLVGADLTDAIGLPGELLAMFGLLGEGAEWIVTEQIWDACRANPKQAEAA